MKLLSVLQYISSGKRFMLKSIGLIPALFLFAGNRVSAQKIIQLMPDWNRYFETCETPGSITLYDLSNDRWYSSDMADSQLQTLPASTFKIVNTLIALDAGVIDNEEELVAWPGQTDTVKYGYRPDIYKDMNRKEAFQLSAGWVYVELAKRIGKEKYAGYLKQIEYGNADSSIDDPHFWNFGELGISPVNQIEILIKVYKETLPFSKVHLNMLNELMIAEKGNDYVIRAKTG